MSWLEQAAIQCSPGIFAGLTVRQWFALLRENRFAVDAPYWPRAAAITAASMLNSAASICESVLFRRRIEQATIEPPIFVLGVWRSGTTLLQNLLCVDRRFAYANYYQVMYPNTFLCTEKIARCVLGLFMPKTRLQDNVEVSPIEPAEDEIATAALTHQSMLLSWSFFRNQAHYDRLLTFRSASAREIAEWQSALLRFVKKLTVKYGRPLVLKSPGHTGRIRLLLQMFPSAKFVHIHRNPFSVFQSAGHTMRKAVSLLALQRPNLENVEERNLSQYKELCDAFFEERQLIPQRNLHDVKFEDLENDPISEMARLYEALRLPCFDEVRPDLAKYVGRLKGYQRNRFPDLPASLRQRIAKQWHRSFEEWGYDPAVAPR